MVTDLLLLDQDRGSRRDVEARGSIKLREVVDDAVRTAKGVKPTAQLDVDVTPDFAVLATREGLDHVVQNLIDNAVKYGAGTPVKVSATKVGTRVRLRWRTPGRVSRRATRSASSSGSIASMPGAAEIRVVRAGLGDREEPRRGDGRPRLVRAREAGRSVRDRARRRVARRLGRQCSVVGRSRALTRARRRRKS